MLKSWEGNRAKTRFIDITDRLDWDMLMSGQKTQMRTRGTLTGKWVLPTVMMGRHGDELCPLTIFGSGPQLLYELTQEEVEAEGFSDLTSFKEHWMRREGVEYFSPNERVIAHLIEPFEPFNPRHLEAMAEVVGRLYPI